MILVMCCTKVYFYVICVESVMLINNQDIDRVVKEVKGVDSAVPTFQIRGQCEFFCAMHTEFCLLCSLNRLQKLESDFFTLNLRRNP